MAEREGKFKPFVGIADLPIAQRHAEAGETAPRSCRNCRQAKWLSYAERLQQLLKERPDATLSQQCRNSIGTT